MTERPSHCITKYHHCTAPDSFVNKKSSPDVAWKHLRQHLEQEQLSEQQERQKAEESLGSIRSLGVTCGMAFIRDPLVASPQHGVMVVCPPIFCVYCFLGALSPNQLLPRLLELAEKALQEEKAALQSLQLIWQWPVRNWWVG